VHLGADALEFQLGVRYVLGVPDECPAECQRLRHYLAKSADADPHHVNVPPVGMFVITWAVALLVWRYGRIEEKWAPSSLKHTDRAS